MDNQEFRTKCQRIKSNYPGITATSCDYDSAEMLQSMCESLAENTMVHTFYVSLSAMKQHGVQVLDQLLQRNITLKHLVVGCHDTKIEKDEGLQEGLPIFVAALAHCHLQQFDIYNLHRGVDHSDFISNVCNGLTKNTTIRIFELGMRVGDNEALAIGNALKVNSGIHTFSIDGLDDSISDFGIKHICDGLQQNCTITDLICRPISSKGVLAVSDMLKANTSIKRLDIRTRGKIGKKAKETLVRTMVEDNFTLEEILAYDLEDSLKVIVDTITRLNTDGRRHKIMAQTNDVPTGLWADVFSLEGGLCLDVLFYFVKSKPELFKL